MEIDPIRLPALLRGLGVLLAIPVLVAGLLTAAHVAQDSAPRRPGGPPSMVDADAAPHRSRPHAEASPVRGASAPPDPPSGEHAGRPEAPRPYPDRGDPRRATDSPFPARQAAAPEELTVQLREHHGPGRDDSPDGHRAPTAGRGFVRI